MSVPPREQTEVVPVQPSRCPACGGREMVTTSKTIGAETYWRCVACGEVWNLDRRRPMPLDRRRY